MNKNTKARRAQALKNFHSRSNPASETSFQVEMSGGQTVTWRIPIGFVQPRDTRRKSVPNEEAAAVTPRSGKPVTVPKK